MCRHIVRKNVIKYRLGLKQTWPSRSLYLMGEEFSEKQEFLKPTKNTISNLNIKKDKIYNRRESNIYLLI